jgi:hypothetical protein
MLDISVLDSVSCQQSVWSLDLHSRSALQAVSIALMIAISLSNGSVSDCNREYCYSYSTYTGRFVDRRISRFYFVTVHHWLPLLRLIILIADVLDSARSQIGWIVHRQAA